MMETKKHAKYPALRGRHKADVAIIGGGLTGLTAALWLRRAGLDTALVEAKTLGAGATGNCSGLLSPCNALGYTGMKKKFGISALESYAQTHMKAIEAIEVLSIKQGLRFPFFKTSLGLVALKGSKMNLSEEAETMKRAGLSVQLKKCSHLFETEQEMLLVQPVYYLQIHAYMNALQFFADSLGVQIYEQSRVIGAEADGVYTEQGSIQAPYLLVATGYPVINTPGWFFLRLEQRCIRRQHINAEINHPLMAEDGSWKLIPKGNKALLQYTDGIVGTDNAVQSFSFPREWKDAMIHHGSNAGIDTFSEDGLPYIGRYSSKTPHLYVGAGYGGDGLAGSMIAAQTISASILGLPASGYDLYQPQRMIKSAKMSINIGKRYIQGMFGGTEVPRCSHMGCKLVYNVSSRLWECPCHGSRFDEIGRVENAPAARPAALGGRKSKGR